MIKKILCILLILVVYTNPVFGEQVAKTSPQYDDYINMTDISNNVSAEIILIIPKEALNNTDSITSLQFLCYQNFYNPPTRNLIFRFFKYYGAGVFSPIDNSFILPSQCIEPYGYQITWNLYSPEIVDHNYDYAFGMYSVELGTGSWEYRYLSDYADLSNPYSYSWVNVSTNAPIINVSILDIIGAEYTTNGSTLRNFPSFKVLGTAEITPTPTPTPGPTNIPMPTSLPNTSGDMWYGNNTTYDPNQTNGTYSTVPNGTGFDTLLRDDGLCTTGSTCTGGDVIEYLTRHINDLFMITMLIVLYRLWSMRS